ncbi:MAG: hypothetical protein M3246_00135 [Actinomycetota bacterium]|nr:hypothetical protein [Actinomycetota bacterium]
MTRNSIVGAGALIFVNAASGTATITYHVWHDALGALGAGFVVGVLATCVPYYVVRELIGRHIRRPGQGIAAALYRKLDDCLDLDNREVTAATDVSSARRDDTRTEVRVGPQAVKARWAKAIFAKMEG